MFFLAVVHANASFQAVCLLSDMALYGRVVAMLILTNRYEIANLFNFH